MLDILKSILYGIVEGITEWLPISSTGHMILLNEYVKMDVSQEFWEMYLVVIQLGAILAVLLMFWNRLFPFASGSKAVGRDIIVKKDILVLWLKIIVACVPAAIIGLLFDDIIDQYLYNWPVVSAMLILVGVLFIIIENYNKHKTPTITTTSQITYKTAALIGVFQVVAAVLPGTSRSGATIIGGILLGLSRKNAADFTFFLAVPVMFGASLLKIVKYAADYGLVSGHELITLLVGMIVAFVVSILAIKFLLGYIKKHDFKVFGWYRIALAVIVIVCNTLILK